MRCLLAVAFALFTFNAPAVILVGTGDPDANATAVNPPSGDLRNSGLQFQGTFQGGIAVGGTPIGPAHFLAADHLQFPVGTTLLFRGVQYVTTGSTLIPGTDLRVWSINPNAPAGPFPTWAPLYTRAASEVSRPVIVFGHGTQRGAAYSNPPATGWVNGLFDQVERWGRNRVRESLVDPGYGDLLRCTFDATGDLFGGLECYLSAGDSSGGLFVQEAGVWKLAGVNLAVENYFESNSSTTAYNALTDVRGMWEGPQNNRTQITGASPVPSGFYCSRVSTYLPQILAIIGQSSAAIDTFAKWRSAVFTPEQLADATLTGATGDPDADGLPNLAEYGFGTGPWMRTNAPTLGTTTVLTNTYLTLTYTRAKNLTDVSYAVEVSSNLQSWSSAAGTTIPVSNVDQGDVTQVTVRDTVPLAPGGDRYLRVRVTKP